jgi:hypothetical protein
MVARFEVRAVSPVGSLYCRSAEVAAVGARPGVVVLEQAFGRGTECGAELRAEA